MTTAPPQKRRVIRFFTAADFKQEPPPPPLAPGDPKHPEVNGVVPETIEVGGSDLTIAVKGSGFTEASVILLDGAMLTSTYVSPNEIRAIVQPSVETTARSVPVVVRNGRSRAKTPVTVTFALPTEAPEGTTEELVVWVNYNPVRAQMALDAELAYEEPRDDLVTELQALIAAGS